MRPAVIWLFVAFTVTTFAQDTYEPWVEEDVEETYEEEITKEEIHGRRRREAYVEDPYEEHIRVKRCDDEPTYRVRRSAESIRTPRQVHQYEVHEFMDDESAPLSPPYGEMLAASAEHYHRVYAAPGAPEKARYLQHDVSGAVPIPVVYNVASKVPVQRPVQFVSSPVKLLAAAPVNVANSAPINSISSAPVSGPISVPASSPVLSAHVPVLGPVPVPSEPVSQPLQKLAAEDLVVAPAHHKHHKHSHGHHGGGGHEHHGHHHKEHGGKDSHGFHKDHYVDKGAKGYKTDELHRKEYEEAAGKKKKHHDHAGHKGSHEEEAHGHKGSKFEEKKGHKKGHKTKGYHNKYHKDEFHKEHKFYDDFHKSGEHHRFGKFNAKHASNESGKKKAHHVNAGHDYVERGKKGYSNKGHMDSDHKGHHGNHGHEEHHEDHSTHGKKGGKEGGSHWGYAKKH